MLSSKHSREVTFEKYRDLLRADPTRVSSEFKVKNPYLDGAVLLQFLHETYGKEKVHAFLLSDASDFWSAVNQVTGHDRSEIFKAWTPWLAGI